MVAYLVFGRIVDELVEMGEAEREFWSWVEKASEAHLMADVGCEFDPK